MTEREDLPLERRTAPEGSGKRGKERRKQRTERESKEGQQALLYQSDRNLRERQAKPISHALIESANRDISASVIAVARYHSCCVFAQCCTTRKLTTKMPITAISKVYGIAPCKARNEEKLIKAPPT